MNSESIKTLRAQSSSLVFWTAWPAVLTGLATLLLLLALHVLSPEFSPSWRMVSEYAFGRYGWVLSLMFLSWGISSWALALALRPELHGIRGEVGVIFLGLAGLGEILASVFDVTHPLGHAIAGVLGVIGFPIAALLLSIDLGRNERWKKIRLPLLTLAHLSWLSVLLLAATLAVMTMQMVRITGGHLPQHAPKVLPAGVLALDGWMDRLIVLSNCAWALAAAWHATRIPGMLRAPRAVSHGHDIGGNHHDRDAQSAPWGSAAPVAFRDQRH
jgi:hypothetical protein